MSLTPTSFERTNNPTSHLTTHQKFKLLNKKHKVITIIATTIIAAFTLGIAAPFLLSALVGRFRKSELKSPPPPPLSGSGPQGSSSSHKPIEIERVDDLGNTLLTQTLAYLAFGDDPDSSAGEQMIESALEMGNHALLVTPNTTHDAFSKNAADSGFPSNTPLMLTVKANDQNLTEMLLPHYKREDLLYVNGRGNSAMHIAVAHGCIHSAYLIYKRAAELGCLEEMLSTPNRYGHTVRDIAKWVISQTRTEHTRRALLPHVMQDSESYVGEEAHKAKISLSNAYTYQKLSLRVIGQFKTIPEEERRELLDFGQALEINGPDSPLWKSATNGFGETRD